MELMLSHKRFAQKRTMIARMLMAYWSSLSVLLTS